MNSPIAKPKVNLVSVTPCDPPEEVAAMDTTTPMDVSVVAFTSRDLPKWGPWLLYRMNKNFPHLHLLNYIGILSEFMNQPGYFLVRAKYAVMLASVSGLPLQPRPIVDIIFLYKHHPDDKIQNKDARLILGACKKWAASMGARTMRVLDPDCVDLNISMIKEVLNTDGDTIFQWSPDAP